MMGRHDPDTGASGVTRPRSVVRIILGIVGVLLIVLFTGLGTWQVQRLRWKLDLIDRVDTRVHAAPVAPPAAADWPRISKDSHEYRHVRLSGRFLFEYSTPVQAVSELGAGYWLITPLCTADGAIVLVNRGFIGATDARERYPARRAAGNPCANAGGAVHSLTGLLRMPEPGGGFLRENDPVKNRWFSRDVAGIAAARGLSQVAPFFVDAAKAQDPADAPEHPVGGLTVISFQNNHLVYAITWYALALMVAGAFWFVARARREPSKARNDGSKA